MRPRRFDTRRFDVHSSNRHVNSRWLKATLGCLALGEWTVIQRLRWEHRPKRQWRCPIKLSFSWAVLMILIFSTAANLVDARAVGPLDRHGFGSHDDLPGGVQVAQERLPTRLCQV